MTIEKVPFVNYTLDSERVDPDKLGYGKVITVRLNQEEYNTLKAGMKILRIKNESTAIKLYAQVGRNVLHQTFGIDSLKWLFDERRVKPE